jgi:hypothetical protein
MEKNTTILRDNNGAVLRRDGLEMTGEGGGAGAMAAAAAAAARAGAFEGTSAATFVTVTGAAGGSFPDIKSEENGDGSQMDNCEETGEGKLSNNNCVASSIESTRQGTGTSGFDFRQGGGNSPSSSLDGKMRICEGNFSLTGFEFAEASPEAQAAPPTS